MEACFSEKITRAWNPSGSQLRFQKCLLDIPALKQLSKIFSAQTESGSIKNCKEYLCKNICPLKEINQKKCRNCRETEINASFVPQMSKPILLLNATL